MDLFMLFLGIAFFVGFLDLYCDEIKNINELKKNGNKESENK